MPSGLKKMETKFENSFLEEKKAQYIICFYDFFSNFLVKLFQNEYKPHTGFLYIHKDLYAWSTQVEYFTKYSTFKYFQVDYFEKCST